jgi:hypothetical protein
MNEAGMANKPRKGLLLDSSRIEGVDMEKDNDDFRKTA